MKTLKDKILNFLKVGQFALTIVSVVVYMIWDLIDIDLGQEAKDMILHIIQIVVIILIFILFIIWFLVPYLKKYARLLRYKRLGIDITKIDTFYEDMKDKKLSDVMEVIRQNTENSLVKEVITDIQKDGIITAPVDEKK
jgi:type VI protein secretion system component VasK